MTEMANIIVYSNGLTGTLPTEIGLLTKLEYLDVGES